VSFWALLNPKTTTFWIEKKMYINIFWGFILYFSSFLIQPPLAPLASPLESPLSSLAVVPLRSAPFCLYYSVSFSTLSFVFFLYILKNNSLKRPYLSDLKVTLISFSFFAFVFFHSSVSIFDSLSIVAVRFFLLLLFIL
jgi:hypothetical protein